MHGPIGFAAGRQKKRLLSLYCVSEFEAGAPVCLVGLYVACLARLPKSTCAVFPGAGGKPTKRSASADVTIMLISVLSFFPTHSPADNSFPGTFVLWNSVKIIIMMGKNLKRTWRVMKLRRETKRHYNETLRHGRKTNVKVGRLIHIHPGWC